MTDQDIREQVRLRYAEAANAVSADASASALAVVDADQCCGTQTSCCGGGEVEAAFGAALYSADEHGELPAEAIAASLGCGNPLAVADLRAGSGCWTWAPVAASTCCSQHDGSAAPASPTAWT